MNKISVVIIAKNEQEIIDKSLRSVTWADEKVVIVDRSSSDDTEKIAKKLGAKTYVRKWVGYANQKNFGISKASNEWVLSIDADEVVSAGLAHQIKRLNPNKDGYFIPFKNHLGKNWLKYGGMYPDYHLRLFRKSAGQFAGTKGGQIHETVRIDNAGRLQNTIDHYTYANATDFWHRVITYSNQEGRELSKQGQKISLIDLMKIPGKFIKVYFLQLGLLDGGAGFINALFLSCYQLNKLIAMVRTK